MSVKHLPGVGTVVRFLFTTHAQTGAAVAPSSAFEAADVRIYKDGSATQRSSEAGYTMTSPFDSVTGLHLLAIDLSDNTDAGFYAVGSEYVVVLSPDETVDSLAVVKVIGYFRIVAAEAVAGTPKVDVGAVSGGATAAANLKTAGDNYSATRGFAGTALPAAAADAAGGLPISDAGGLDLDAKLANTNEVTAARMGALTDWINGGRLDLLLDAIKAVTDLLPNGGALTTIGTDTARLTAARAQAIDDWINGGRLDLLLDAIKAVTDALPNGGALSNLDAAVSTRATPAQVNSEADTALADVGVTLARMGALTDWINGGRLDLLLDAVKAVTDLLPDGGALTTLAADAARLTATRAGYLDNLSAGAVATAAALAAVAADLPTRITKNTALANFPFQMVDETDGKTAETGLTVTATRSLDGGAFGACANAVTEIGLGWYKISLAAGDLNGDTIILRFTATGARSTHVVVVTQPT